MLQARRTFGKASRYVGPNDNIREERREMRKYGMKRHFYDNIAVVQKQVPNDQFRQGLSKDELAPYPEEIRMAFSLNNASD